MKTDEFSVTSAPHTPTEAINGKKRKEKLNIETAARAQKEQENMLRRSIDMYAYCTTIPQKSKSTYYRKRQKTESQWHL